MSEDTLNRMHEYLASLVLLDDGILGVHKGYNV